MEQYMQFTGMTSEKMLEEFKPQALKRIQTRLVLEAIVKAENIEISDERLDEELAKIDVYKRQALQEISERRFAVLKRISKRFESARFFADPMTRIMQL